MCVHIKDQTDSTLDLMLIKFNKSLIQTKYLQFAMYSNVVDKMLKLLYIT